MDPAVTAAVVGAAGVVAGAVATSPVIVHILTRRLRAAQAEQLRAQATQLQAQAAQSTAQTDLLRQDLYQQITGDLQAELGRVQTALADARESLRITNAEAERLRVRVVELESRLAHVTTVEAELQRVQAERDQLRIDLAARDATIRELQQHIADLRVSAAQLQTPPGQPATV